MTEKLVSGKALVLAGAVILYTGICAFVGFGLGVIVTGSF